MSIIGAIQLGQRESNVHNTDWAREVAIPRRRAAFLRDLFMLFFIIFSAAIMGSPAFAQAANNLGVAHVFVESFMDRATDEISFKILANHDQQLLVNAVQALSVQFGQLPTNVQYFDHNPNEADDPTACVTLNLPIVSRMGGRLPIDQFIQAFAPYVSQLAVGYAIHGSYQYQPFSTQYPASQVQLNEDTPKISANTATEPFAIYLADVKILSQSLSSSAASQAAKIERGRRRNIMAIAIGAALIIFALGLLLALLMPRRKEMPERSEN
jgi:hypothetical protein